jgi:hypothetical protein
MNNGIPNNTPEKITLVASRFAACNKPQYASGNLVTLKRSWCEAAMCKHFRCYYIDNSFPHSISMHSDDNSAEAEERCEAILGSLHTRAANVGNI